MKLLASNFRTRFGEIDLIFRDGPRVESGEGWVVGHNGPEGDCLVFVEVKTRSSDQWTRPADAVNRSKQRRISATAHEYVRGLGRRDFRMRFDIVEVCLRGEGEPEIRHLVNAFPMASNYFL